jgi:hypothetical protein
MLLAVKIFQTKMTAHCTTNTKVANMPVSNTSVGIPTLQCLQNISNKSTIDEEHGENLPILPGAVIYGNVTINVSYHKLPGSRKRKYIDLTQSDSESEE